MTDEDIRKLLGGYATGTLSDEEQKALFDAALDDEKLFAALAEEQALREMLDDAGHRAALLEALEPAKKGWAWRWMVPLGVAAALVVAVSTVVLLRPRDTPNPVLTTQMAVPEARMESRAAAPAPSMDAVTTAPPMRAKKEVRDKVAESELSDRTQTAPSPALAVSDAVSVSAEAGLSMPVRARQQGTLNSAGKVQYTILKRAADGQFRPVNATTTLQLADAVRLNVAAEESGLLSVSQKNPPKMLFQGVVQSQVPVIVPVSGNLDLSNGGPLQIVFSQAAGANALQRMMSPAAVAKRKAETEKDSVQKTLGGAQGQAQSQNQAAYKDLSSDTITVDVNLNVAAPSQQQK